MRLRTISAFSTVALASCVVVCAAVETNSKGAVPRPVFETLVQNCPDVVENPLRFGEQVIVLDFWATWCAPCVQEIPRMNRLTAEFAAEGVVFVAVTDEEPNVVTDFLDKLPMQACVAIDSDRSVFDSYSVTSRPFVVVIDKSRHAHVIGHSSQLSSELLRDILAGRDPGVFVTRDEPSDEPSSDNLFESWIRASRSEMFFMSVGPGRLDAQGFTPLELIVQATALGAHRLVLEAELPTYRYDAKVTTPSGDWRLPLLSALESTFGFRATDGTERLKSLVIVSFKPQSGALGATGSGLRAHGAGVSGVGDVGALASVLERALATPVVDESGVAAAFEWDLKWEKQELDEVRNALSQAGFVTRYEFRDVRIVLLRATVPPGTP